MQSTLNFEVCRVNNFHRSFHTKNLEISVVHSRRLGHPSDLDTAQIFLHCLWGDLHGTISL